MTYSPTVRIQPRSRLTSIDNTIPAPNLKKCMVHSCTKAKPTIRPCSRILITLTPGKSVNTLYPFALHESLGDLWDYSVTAGKFVLRLRGCDLLLDNMQINSWQRCLGTGRLQKYRTYCKECWIHHIAAVTFELNHLAHIIKPRKRNCMRVTNLHAHWWAPNPRACYWNVNVDGDSKTTGHHTMDRGKDLLQSLQWIKVGEIYRLIDSSNDGTNYYLGNVH